MCFFFPGRIFNFIRGSRICGGSRWGWIFCCRWMPWAVALPWHEIFRIGDPNLNLHLPLASWGGQPNKCHRWLWNIETHNITGGDSWQREDMSSRSVHFKSVLHQKKLRVVIQNVGLHPKRRKKAKWWSHKKYDTKKLCRRDSIQEPCKTIGCLLILPFVGGITTSELHMLRLSYRTSWHEPGTGPKVPLSCLAMRPLFPFEQWSFHCGCLG